ncbi:hypothetical protein AM588_10003589 [Phytophthora nicotianae]|uniref:NADP-dependent oxidoreductase domain-containing protein n=1 Tax=Phytophthora nicotianae TaxID=4792 RepID=A0A0W8D4Z5_PHYNI|nr:hypothetical protein AM588_10003589 [Phytophthora nicotianae]
MSVFVQSKLLPSGHSIPSLALGMFQSSPGAEAYNAVLTALKLGYRHIDTATFYENEGDVGRAIRDSGISRKEIFVTSKYFEMHGWSYHRVVNSVRESNRELGLGFGKGHLLKLAKTWRVKPAVNQVELHPWLARRDTVKFCEDQGIILEAYSPLAQGKKMDDPVIMEIAKELNATQAQVMVAWSLAKGFIALPKSVRESHIKSNLDASNQKLSVNQMMKLGNLDEYFISGWDPIRHHNV